MSDDVSKPVVISNRQGLHARPAHAFVSLAKEYQAKITLAKAGETVDGKSILEILTLAAVQGTELVVRGVGDDAEAAVSALVDLLGGLKDEPAEPAS